jgi:hypothetical protein
MGECQLRREKGGGQRGVRCVQVRQVVSGEGEQRLSDGAELPWTPLHACEQRTDRQHAQQFQCVRVGQ